MELEIRHPNPMVEPLLPYFYSVFRLHEVSEPEELSRRKALVDSFLESLFAAFELASPAAEQLMRYGLGECFCDELAAGAVYFGSGIGPDEFFARLEEPEVIGWIEGLRVLFEQRIAGLLALEVSAARAH